jgi:hypothetical protein
MARYDSRVLHEFADRLLADADQAVVAYGAIGAFAGMVVGFVVSSRDGDQRFWVIAMALIFALVAGIIGKRRAFTLRILAQTTLCQVQIEENTRRAAEAALASAPPRAPSAQVFR